MPIAQNVPFQVAENRAAQNELPITGDAQPLTYEAQTTVEYEQLGTKVAQQVTDETHTVFHAPPSPPNH